MKKVDRSRYTTWLFQAAENFYERGNFDKALKYFERLLKHQGKFLEPAMKADCYAYMGDIFLFNEDFSKATDYLNKAIHLDDGFAHYYYLLGMVYQTQENWRRAIEEFESAIELEPKNSIYVEELGRTYVLTGNLSEGERLLKQAWKLDPDSVGAGVELSGVLFTAGKFKDCIDVCEELLSNPDQLHEGIIDYLEGISEDARKGLEEAAKRRRRSKKKRKRTKKKET